jgi:hypothetical protein
MVERNMIVRHAYPARQIAINAGEDGSVIAGKILAKDQYASLAAGASRRQLDSEFYIG